MNPHVTLAIFKRNFVSYFFNPLGYVFIWVFVMITAIGAFWPDEFFNDNLANLDQLNSVLPLALLIFIPAVSMGIWSEERRLGTDELVLTIPASDIDVVLGKYFAAVAIYIVALLFSLSNVFMLSFLGTPDLGVVFANYLGYLLMGQAMLSIGMVASFLTRNNTVAFVLGVVFNAPLVFLQYADSLFKDPQAARFLREFSAAEQFQDFGHGLITLSSVVFFVGISVVMLYLCMVLIARRHWEGSTHAAPDLKTNWFVDRLAAILVSALLTGTLIALGGFVVAYTWYGWMDQNATVTFLILLFVWAVVGGLATWFLTQGGEHFLLRALSLAAIAIGLSVISNRFDLRADVSEEQLSALSPQTVALLDALRSNAGTVAGDGATNVVFIGNEQLSARDGAFVGTSLRFVTGKLKDEVRRVTGYDGKTKQLTVAHPFTAAPAKSDQFVLERPPVVINAFVSPEVPEQYVQTRLNLLAMLREIDSRGGNQVSVNIFETRKLSNEALVAEDQYQIRSRPVQSVNRGSVKLDEIFLGVACQCGLQKVVVPFFDRGLPVEYELIRSIATVSQQQRKKLGVITTDAPLYGRFDFQRFSQTPNQPFIDELEKQYDVTQLTLDTPVSEQFDALLAVQPSSLGPAQLDNLVRAVQAGYPTVVFEDPMPYFDQSVPGSSQPRQAPNQGMGGMMGMMGGQQPPPAKGNMMKFWTLLGVTYDPGAIIYQSFNPYPKIQEFPEEFVFTGPGSGNRLAFSPESEATAKLNQVLFPFPGALVGPSAGDMRFQPLIKTGKDTGYVNMDDIIQKGPFGQTAINNERKHYPTKEEYTLAARIRGVPLANKVQKMADEGSPAAAAAGTSAPAGTAVVPPPKLTWPGRAEGEVDVAVVADIDVLYSIFFNLRERGNDPNADVFFDFDNVTFVLNLVDDMAGDDRFIDIRNRRRRHRMLTTIQQQTNGARLEASQQVQKFRAESDEKRKKIEEDLNKAVEALQKEPGDDVSKLQKLQIVIAQNEKKLKVEEDRLKRDLERNIENIERDLELKTREVQSMYKLLASSIPPIPPLLLAGLVFLLALAGEREGVSTRRLR